MCRADLGKVVSYLGGHLNESKLLSEWNAELNHTFTKRERLTIRELAVAFKIIKKRGILTVDHDYNCYCFTIS